MHRVRMAEEDAKVVAAADPPGSVRPPSDATSPPEMQGPLRFEGGTKLTTTVAGAIALIGLVASAAAGYSDIVHRLELQTLQFAEFREAQEKKLTELAEVQAKVTEELKATQARDVARLDEALKELRDIPAHFKHLERWAIQNGYAGMDADIPVRPRKVTDDRALRDERPEQTDDSGSPSAAGSSTAGPQQGGDTPKITSVKVTQLGPKVVVAWRGKGGPASLAIYRLNAGEPELVAELPNEAQEANAQAGTGGTWTWNPRDKVSPGKYRFSVTVRSKAEFGGGAVVVSRMAVLK